MDRNSFDQTIRTAEGAEAELAHVGAASQPNLRPLRMALRDLPALALNVKSMGYELARKLARGLPERGTTEPRHVSLLCKPCTQSDMQSEWVRHWLTELKSPVLFHRKLWEFAYVLQALHNEDLIRPGARGVGFGCGAEPIASYLASKGVKSLVTDLQPEVIAAQGWRDSHQHASSLEAAFHAHLVSRTDFDAHVSHRFVDMNAVPSDLCDFDFCWSICALEHLGTIAKGLDFIKNSMQTLKPGGVAVHTTEFNFLDDANTVDNWPTVLFQRDHFRRLAAELTAAGHDVAPLDFDTGCLPMDQFIDVPPFEHDWSAAMRTHLGGESRHLKLNIDGFAATCFGLVVTKRPLP